MPALSMKGTRVCVCVCLHPPMSDAVQHPGSVCKPEKRDEPRADQRKSESPVMREGARLRRGLYLKCVVVSVSEPGACSATRLPLFCCALFSGPPLPFRGGGGMGRAGGTSPSALWCASLCFVFFSTLWRLPLFYPRWRRLSLCFDCLTEKGARHVLLLSRAFPPSMIIFTESHRLSLSRMRLGCPLFPFA